MLSNDSIPALHKIAAVARVAAIYDVHGNLPALEAVLRDIETCNVDAIVVGGDVLPGPMAAECLNLLFGTTTQVFHISGNGDRNVLESHSGKVNYSLPEPVRNAVRWNAAQLDSSQLLRVRQWPETLMLHIADAGNVLFCHATHRSDSEIFMRQTPDAALMEVFRDVNVRTVICGHTHMQFDRKVGNIRIVNAGSVGMPFGTAAAHWLLLGNDIEMRQTAYDLSQAATRIRGTDFPGAEDFAERCVLHPASENAMLAVYAKSEIGAHRT